MSKRFEHNMGVRFSSGTFNKLKKVAETYQLPLSSVARVIIEDYFRGQDEENLDFIKMGGGV
jgi:hypothetical protein